MTKTVSMAELGHGGASRAIHQAQQEPVLVCKENRPAAWIVSTDALAELAAVRGDAAGIYQQALELIAIDLYKQGVVTLGRASRLAGMSIGDFIDLCGRLHVPILWEPAQGIGAEVEAFTASLEDARCND